MTRPRRPTVVAVAALVALLAIPAGAGYAALRSDRITAGVLPPGTTVGGVDVSGMDRSAALAAVRRVVERDFDRAAGLLVGSRSYVTTQRSLGAGDDAEAAVDTALRQSAGRPAAGGLLDRLTHRSRAVSVSVRVNGPQPNLVQALVARAMRDAALDPVSARVRLSAGWLRFTAAVEGRRLDPAVATAALTAALRDGLPRTVAPDPVAPEVGNAALDTVVLIRTGENRLIVYKRQRVARIFSVATGSPDFPTPTGHFHIAVKRYLPTWINPHPNEGWGKLEPASIPPGPNNPLGTRAMNLDVPNIRIHGTPAAASVGYSASHGCIRMRMADAEALYPMLPTGTSVFVTSAGPPKLPPPGAGVSVASLAEGG